MTGAVIEFHTGCRPSACGLVILQPTRVGWSLWWAEARTPSEPWKFADFTMKEPAEISARALADRFGAEFLIGGEA